MKTIQIRIKEINCKFNIVGEAFNGNESATGSGGLILYILDTLKDAKNLQSQMVMQHNECEKLNPSKISRIAVAI